MLSQYFTLDQIKAAHSKVKSGADFPKYVQELKTLGIVIYDNYVVHFIEMTCTYYDKKGNKLAVEQIPAAL